MSGSFTGSQSSSTEIRGRALPLRAKICTGKFGRVCRALWPDKTAEHFAARAHCSIRTAKYRFSGEYEPTAEDLRIVINEMLA